MTPDDATRGTLSDVLHVWTVVRRWRGIEARTAIDAIDATGDDVIVDETGKRVAIDHHDVHATHGELTLLYHALAEIDMLLELIGNEISAIEAAKPDTEAAASLLRARWALLNSLRTQFAEARNDLVRTSGD